MENSNLVMKKICNKCCIEKELNEFHKCRTLKDGFKNECKVCIKLYRENNIDKYKKIEKEYRENNKEKRNKNNKLYREIEENKNKKKEQDRERYIKNSDKYKELNRIYYYNNKDRFKKNHRNYIKYRKEIDPLFKLKCAIRTLVTNSISKGGFNKNSKTEEVLGCSFNDFKNYLESKFENWMNWSNHGLYNGEYEKNWQIDHIIPISAAETEEDIIRLNHYTNLQPLCSKVNMFDKKNLIIIDNEIVSGDDDPRWSCLP
jgi:hypothetical protein